MRFLADKVNSLRIGWNERPLSEPDFYRLCRRYKIGVQEMPLRVSGFYYRVMGQDFIAVDSRLTGIAKLTVLFHELGHFLFHAPETGATANFHGVGHRTRKECEADVFALCAVIPRRWIESRTAAEIIDEGIAPELVRERSRIYARHGL
jgi:Zn-dependent peptidase ImmA (M78 family)